MGPAPGADGPPVPLACVLPRGDYTVLDDWGGGATLALQGTGSNSVRVDDVFVPEHLVEHYDCPRPLRAPHPAVGGGTTSGRTYDSHPVG